MMDKLLQTVCDELKEIEKQGLKGSNFEMADKLLNMKKNLLKIEMLEGDGESYRSYRGNSYDGSYDGGMSGRHWVRGHYSRDGYSRDSYRGYSRGKDDMVEQLEGMMQEADGETREELRRVIAKLK